MERTSSYRMRHRPPDATSGAPLHDLTENGIYPEDVYEMPSWYASSREELEGWAVAERVRGSPEARVPIYRAVPCEVRPRAIRQGDWVSTSRAYARQHGKHRSDPAKDMCVLSAQTSASCLHTDGNSLAEWGYNCPTMRAKLSFKP
jgi:hypothetical protein